ncbi:MAG: hypothetical protein AAFQ80_16745 [Cyanobacteria bacterium J06621_8]
MPENNIIIITDEESELSVPEGQKGWGEEVARRVSGLREVRLNPTELENKMADFLQTVRRLFRQAEEQSDQDSGMHLTEVELSVEIGAEGEVKLVAGGKATGKGAIKLKFTKINSR